MPRELTNPQTRMLVNRQIVTDVGYHIEFIGGAISMDRSTIRYKVTGFAGTEPVKVAEMSVRFSQLPPAVKTKMKELHNLIITHADANGLLLPGSDTDDF